MAAHEYIWWNTRWLGMVIEMAGERNSGLVSRYPWQLLGGMGVLYAGCCCVAFIISGCHLTRKRVLGAGALAFAVMWLTVPDGEVFYWWPATVEYLLPTSLLAMLLWVMAARRGRVGVRVTGAGIRDPRVSQADGFVGRGRFGAAARALAVGGMAAQRATRRRWRRQSLARPRC
jgi:hypothetical protein